MYAIVHRNGTDGIYSNWYIDEKDIPTLEEAIQKRKEFRKTHPRSDGWWAHIRIKDGNGYGELVEEEYE